uniref:Mini-chromosome maintenance complex-binding protein n=1 Tax=Hyaloperonospora arabidopsidis (strain Emoy2) TaxID=559515 RepID=M4BCC3_HYAAE
MFDLSSLSSAAAQDVSDAPVLDETSFYLGAYRDGSVLKFRGLVRDVQDPEFVQLGGETRPPTDATDLIERVPLIVTIFPHATDWAQRAYCKVPKLTRSDGRCSQSEGLALSKGIKRSSAAVNEPTTNGVGQKTDEMNNKKTKAMDENEDVQKKTQEANWLLSPAINIYIYDGQYKDVPIDAFKVNEAFEFVGILDLTVPSLGTKGDTLKDVLSVEQLKELQISDCIEQVQGKKDQGSVVLHCCHVSSLESVQYVRPHESRECYEQIKQSNDSRSTFCRDEWSKLGHEMDVAAMRKQLVDYLTQAVGGDLLAAEYLLLGLLSHVYSRADPSTPLGNLSLNLSLDKSLVDERKQEFIARVYETLALLMPMVVQVDLSLEELNSSRYKPYKDYDREALVSGVLQVANGTTMLVNETALTAGQLNDQGVKNIAALQSLVEKMLLPYDFQYYDMDFPQDVVIVTVSEGSTILPVTVAVLIVGTNSTTADVQPSSLPEDQLFECFRLFLCVLRSSVVTIRNEEAEMAEKHYVECRKSQQKVALDDLHRWLRLARLMALSRGEGNISKDSWNAMLMLETERVARLAAEKSS